MARRLEIPLSPAERDLRLWVEESFPFLSRGVSPSEPQRPLIASEYVVEIVALGRGVIDVLELIARIRREVSAEASMVRDARRSAS